MKNDTVLNHLIDQWAADRPARRLDADRVRCQIEEAERRKQIRATRKPCKQLTDPWEMEQDRLKQVSHGAHE